MFNLYKNLILTQIMVLFVINTVFLGDTFIIPENVKNSTN